ncbi:MAG: hypothetical protein AAF074_08625 [Pseudomonadota bacterium]
MKTLTGTLLALGLMSSASVAGTDFGSKQDAMELTDKIISIIDADGLSAGIEALFDPEQPFATSRMGVNVFAGTVVVGDNREPEMVAADYATTPDLTGALVWPLIDAAADDGADVVLKWYHYDTQEVYDYHCFSQHAANPNYTVMVCR